MSRHAAWLVPCALSALACVCAAAQGPQAPAREATHLNQPMQSEESAAPDVNEVDLRARLQVDPRSPDLLYQLALLQRQKGQFRESLQTYTHAAGMQKPNAAQLRSVALDYVQLNDYDDAIRWLRVAAGMEPGNIEVLYSLGRCLYTQNLFAEAEAAFAKVLQLVPSHLKAEENLGLVYDAENKPQKAEEALRTAARWADERNVHDSWPYLDAGSFLLDQNRAQEALPFLKKAAALATDSAQCHEKLGRALGSTGDRNGAVLELEVAVKLEPGNAKTHFELGRAYRDAGDSERARAEFDVSKSLYGTHNQN